MKQYRVRPVDGLGVSNLIVVAIVAGCASVAGASDWTNSAGGFWDNAANWSVGVPVVGGAAGFGLDGDYDVAVASSPFLSTLGFTAGRVDLAVGASHNLAALNFDLANAEATLTGGIMTIGTSGAANPAGIFRINNGRLNAAGVGVDLRANTSDLEMGTLPGTSILDISQSALVAVRRLVAGAAVNSHSFINIHDNANNTLFKTKGSIIGQAGAATLLISNEGRMNVEPFNGGPALTIGYGDAGTGLGGTGYLRVDGNISLLNIKGEIRIADGPKSIGDLIVTNGARAAFSGTNSVPVAMNIGRDGGEGQLQITGRGSSMKLNGALVIHQNANEYAARVENGAQLTVSSIQFIGDATKPIAGFVVKGREASLDTSGDVDIASGNAIFTDTAQINVGGDLRIGATDTAKATVRFENGSLHANRIVIDGGDLTLTAGANKVVRAGSIAFTTPDSGVIDLADNALMVDYFEGDASPLTQIERSINPGADNPLSMARIVSSTAGLNPDRYALGVAEGSDLPAVAAGLRTFFRENADNTSVLVRYTLRGDADLNGAVDLDDFTVLAAGFGTTDSRWFRGDFNYDGETNLSDFTLLAANFGQALPVSDAGRSNVPEPASAAVIAVMAMAAARRRK